MTKSQICEKLTNPGLLPVIRLESGEKLPFLLDALLAGGVSAAELTMTMPNALHLLSENRKRFGDSFVLGMGTVTDETMARNAVDAGTQFLVSPFPVLELPAVAAEADIPAIVGAFSPKEVYDVARAGADFVKVFPLNVVGINYIKDLHGPLPYVKFFPTGGITLENIPALFKAGVAGCGVGGSLVKKELIAADDWAGITELARKFVEMAKNSR